MTRLDSLTIRPVRPEEHEATGELIVEAYRTLDDVELGDYEEKLRDVAARAAGGEVLVAELGGKLVGSVTYIDGQGAWSEADDPDAGSIRMLGVLSSARGNGIGEALVMACIDRAVASGRRRLRLSTRTTMKSAQRIYERLGFRREAQHDRSPAPGINLMGYVLDLDSSHGDGHSG
jgi:ribosomal protein S18 acetylase RimI-like enzyme